MAGRVYGKKLKGKVYYYYQESYRTKVDPAAGHGKTKGSGPSKVHVRSIYLGSAEDVLALKQGARGPAELRHRAFGLLAAALQVAEDSGLTAALQTHITGARFGLPRWLFFLVTILNRLDHATSKNRMGAWAKNTVLPDVLEFDPALLTSKNYWYVTDDVLSEAELKRRRQAGSSDADDLFAGLDDRVFADIEADVLARLRPLFPAEPARCLVYDTTNFFTFFEDPDASELARTGHNKDAHHHLRQVGLALAADQVMGVPFFHRVYRGNRQDARSFAGIVGDLVVAIGRTFPCVEDLVLVLDKGNNSKDNFAALDGKIDWVGSLTPTQHQDMLAVPVEEYDGAYDGLKTLHRTKTVMGRPCRLVMTYYPALARKQEHAQQNGIDKLTRQLRQRYDNYKTKPTTLTPGLKRILAGHRARNLIRASFGETGMLVEPNEEELAKRRQRLGKNLLFTPRLDAADDWIIPIYKSKETIEDDFKTLKDPDLIRIRPLRHWTDTKIRAYIFCCVMSLLLIRLMQHRAAQAGLHMSPAVLKEELTDLREIIMIYDDGRAERKISAPSSIQKKLWDLFHLEKIEKLVTLHERS
jgi:transposase